MGQIVERKPTRLGLGIRVLLANAQERPGRQCFGGKTGCEAVGRGEDCGKLETHASSKDRGCSSSPASSCHGETAHEVLISEDKLEMWIFFISQYLNDDGFMSLAFLRFENPRNHLNLMRISIHCIAMFLTFEYLHVFKGDYVSL